MTTPDAFPLPRVQDCLDAVRGAKYFSTFDITSGYHQVPVRKEDVPKTAFITKYGLYEFKTMPMGLSTASATFQRLMELILQGLNWNTCIIYLDDIVVYGKTLEEHLERVEQVLEKIGKSGMKLKPEKCHLLQESVNFLGHVVSKDGVLPSADNVAKILQWPRPQNITEIRQFLGMASYYRRFIQGFAKIANPMVRLTKKEVDFQWDESCEESFQTLKKILAGPEIMAFPKDGEEFILDTDASGEAIGAVLSQMRDGRERVISYGSRALSKSERNYCITDKELLAVRHFVEYYKQYLLGRKFLVRTDHQALVWLFKLKEPKDRTARWLEILSAYKFEIQHRAGQKHGNADALSRCVDPANCSCTETDNLQNLRCGPCRKCLNRMKDMGLEIGSQPLTRAVRTRAQDQEEVQVQIGTEWKPCFTQEAIRREQLKDPDLQIVFRWLESEQRPDIKEICLMTQAARHYWHTYHQLQISNGVLVRRAYKHDSIESFSQILAPKTLQKEALRQAHDAPMGGHFGRRKTQDKILQNFYWYGLREDVSAYVTTCQICQKNKRLTKGPKGRLGSMLVGAPMDRVSVDILGPLPETPDGNKYILTVTDHFTNWVEAIPLPNQTAITVANALLKEVISRFGCPATLHSDQGTNFESQILHEMCEFFHIKKTRSSPRHPQGNGKTERFNRTLISMIKCFIKDDKTEWDRNLNCITAAYRASTHEVTGMTPNLLMLGREVRTPLDVMIGGRNISSLNAGDHVTVIRDNLQKAHKIARSKLGKASQKRQEDYDLHIRPYIYKVGDKILYLNERKAEGKFSNTYEGPGTITKKLSDLTFQIRINSGDGKKSTE